MKKKLELPGLFLVAAMAVLLISFPLISEETPGSPVNGFFWGLTFQDLSFGGELDGKLILGKFDRLFFIPKLEKSSGYGATIGYRHQTGLWHVAYLQSVHKTIFQGVLSQSTYNTVDANTKVYLFKRALFQPYFLLGISIPWIKVKGGSTVNDTVVDVTYSGVGINAGGGMLLQFGPRIFLTGGIISRWFGLLYVRGNGRARDIGDLSVNNTGPKRDKYLRVFGLSLEFSLGFVL